MVKWFAVLSDGNAMEGSVDDGSWRDLRLKLEGRKIVKLHIFNESNDSQIDQNKDGYFVGNKIITGMGCPQLDFVGIGYYQRHDDMARIKWHDAKTLDLIFTEARKADECGFSLITNP